MLSELLVSALIAAFRRHRIEEMGIKRRRALSSTQKIFWTLAALCIFDLPSHGLKLEMFDSRGKSLSNERQQKEVVNDAIQVVSCYIYQKEETERVAFPFLVGLLSGGPLLGIVTACTAAQLSKYCNQPMPKPSKKSFNYNNYLSSFWEGQDSRVASDDNPSYISTIISYVWGSKDSSLAEKPYTEDDIFGGILGGLLAGFMLRNSIVTALMGAVAASFVATTQGWEGDLIRFLGASLLNMLQLCRIASRRAYEMGWEQVVQDAYDTFWNTLVPQIITMKDSALVLYSQIHHHMTVKQR